MANYHFYHLTYYLCVLPLLFTFVFYLHLQLFDNVLATDDVLRRPVTPSYIRSNTDRLSNIGDTAAVR